MRKQPKETPHHIANIAHLFFEDEAVQPARKTSQALSENIVVCFSSTGLGENVCEYLNRENSDVTWEYLAATRLQHTGALDEKVIRSKLVLCLLESEVGDCEIALKVGRVLGILPPRHLQVLVFTDHECSPPESLQTVLLKWCGQITRMLAGRCSVAIALLPEGSSAALATSSSRILKNISRRLSF